MILNEASLCVCIHWKKKKNSQLITLIFWTIVFQLRSWKNNSQDIYLQYGICLHVLCILSLLVHHCFRVSPSPYIVDRYCQSFLIRSIELSPVVPTFERTTNAISWKPRVHAVIHIQPYRIVGAWIWHEGSAGSHHTHLCIGISL